MTKEGMDWLIRPFYEPLLIALFRCCEHINQRNPQNIAALKNESIFIVNEKKRRRIVYYDTPSFFIDEHRFWYFYFLTRLRIFCIS